MKEFEEVIDSKLTAILNSVGIEDISDNQELYKKLQEFATICMNYGACYIAMNTKNTMDTLMNTFKNNCLTKLNEKEESKALDDSPENFNE